MYVPPEAVQAVDRAIKMLERKRNRVNETKVRRAAARGDTTALRIVRAWEREDGRKSFQPYLPDGRRVSNLAQVAASMNVSLKVAAAYVLEEKDVLPELLLEAKKLLPPNDSDQDGVAIMLMPDPEDAVWLLGGSDVAVKHEQLHITLGYFGDIDEAPEKSYLTVICKALAQTFDPIEANIAGITRFNGPEDSPNDAVVLNVDSSKIEDIRIALVQSDYDKKMKRNHGYTPHMTIGYIPKHKPLDFTRWPAPFNDIEVAADKPIKPINIDRITLMYGRDHIDYPLGTDDDRDHGQEQKDVFHGNGEDENIPPKRKRIKKIIERAKRIADLEEEEDD